MNIPLQQVYLVSQPTGTTRHTGQDLDASGAVTAALTTTILSGDRRGWFNCNTLALPVEGADLTACLTPGNPAWSQLVDVLTNMLASVHTDGGRRRRALSGTDVATEARRILEARDYSPFLLAIDGLRVSGVRLNSSPVAADEAAELFLVVHDRHLIAIESHNGAGPPETLTADPNGAT